MASADYIKISRDQNTALESVELLALIRDLRSAYERAGRIRAKMRHNFSDGAGEASINWSAVEALYGIPAGNTSVGSTANGARVFTFIDGAAGSMEGTFQTSAAKDMTETVG